MLGEVGSVTRDVARIMRSNRNEDILEAGKVTRWEAPVLDIKDYHLETNKRYPWRIRESFQGASHAIGHNRSYNSRDRL